MKNARWVELIRHMTGATPNRRRSIHGYRNHFCADVEGEHWKDMQAMIDEGLVVAGAVINYGQDQYFHATHKGCEYAGLHKAAIKRACPGPRDNSHSRNHHNGNETQAEGGTRSGRKGRSTS